MPLAPIVLATGWSALVVFALRIPLNPMSVTLGALVIAISTEFSVLLSERHRQERWLGHSTVQALRRAYRHTGAAVAASGVTAIAGFGVLILSDIAMLRDFGLVTLVDLSVSLLGVLIALPAAVVIAESEQPSERAHPRRLCARSRGSSPPAREAARAHRAMSRIRLAGDLRPMTAPPPLASPTIPGARVKRATQREAWAVEGEAWLLEWEARLTVESRGRVTASMW